MLLYYIHKKSDGDLELRSFSGSIRGGGGPRFYESAKACIESYRQEATRQEDRHKRGLRNTNEDKARLLGLEEQIDE